ncbi:hypothetical protein F5Y18DRAFT_398581 [Xylariaceae sp. FL1019]|nr:hypothetical protein F5Y18DRAFT_398581 [Xylariaceae sp. FL1019]
MATHLEFPAIFLLPTHFDDHELPELESQIPTLTYDINEAKIILGKVNRRMRAILELKSRKILTEEIVLGPVDAKAVDSPDSSEPRAKRRKIEAETHRAPGSGDSTASDTESEEKHAADKSSSPARPRNNDDSIVEVVKLAWFTESQEQGRVLPVEDYLVYRGRKQLPVITKVVNKPRPDPKSILKRAREEIEGAITSSQDRPSSGYADAKFHPRSSQSKRPHLVPQTTSEDEEAANLPPVPEYLHTSYSCQRPTPLNSPNDALIEQLKKVRTLRQLEGDEVGVRAYSTSIAAVAAYPYLLSSPIEVARLPGCSSKIAALWQQWKSNGYLEEVQEASSDERLKVLLLFYEIWGVAAKTANEFYNKGWRDLDDIVENGWDTITRVQQIGVKYYDDIQEGISRAEVEAIGDVILKHARKIAEGFQMVIVGGYRRGKSTSGDVDVVLSHPDPKETQFFINAIVRSLEGSGHITHMLTLSDKNSERGQDPVAWKGEDRKAGGFDTLDKALVMWQDPVWDKKLATKNPNKHHRVDIIISPWKTAGCAVLGWSGATTFERDLRLYCKHEKQIKFDSSGARSRTGNGEWIDLESDENGNPAPDMLTAEKRVFERLGLEWRPPEERCTG